MWGRRFRTIRTVSHIEKSAPQEFSGWTFDAGPHYHLSIADDHIELIEGNGHTKVVAFRLFVLIPSTAHGI